MSVTLAWCFEDAATAATEALLDRVVGHGAVVPQLRTQEIANVLVVAERRGRVTEAQAAGFTSLLAQLPIVVAPEWPSTSALLALARQWELTAYDAAYLWLTEMRGPTARHPRRPSAPDRRAGATMGCIVTSRVSETRSCGDDDAARDHRP